MLAKLQKWGNSQGIRVTKNILEESEFSIGEFIEISARKGQIIIKSVSKIRGKYKLKDLIEKVPKNYKSIETDWGNPTGKEEW